MRDRFQGDEDNIRRAAALIRTLKGSVVLTGAGISTPSGIPDFRSAGSGLWTRYDPMEVASLSAFRYHPEKFFAWLRPLAQQMVKAQPNPAHLALARLESAGYLDVVITQNIDGLHQKAGSSRVLEIHGSLQTLTCIGCFKQYQAGDFFESYLDLGEIPRCASCKHVLKPDVILFEEQLPISAWRAAQRAVRSCRIMLVAGSSLEVTPAANLPFEAVQHSAKLILVNQTETYLDQRADVLIPGDVAVILPRLADEVLDG